MPKKELFEINLTIEEKKYYLNTFRMSDIKISINSSRSGYYSVDWESIDCDCNKKMYFENKTALDQKDYIKLIGGDKKIKADLLKEIITAFSLLRKREKINKLSQSLRYIDNISVFDIAEKVGIDTSRIKHQYDRNNCTHAIFAGNLKKEEIEKMENFALQNSLIKQNI